MAEITFKKDSNDKRSFNLAAYKNDTEKIFENKTQKYCPQNKEENLRKWSHFNRSSLRCNLCLNEKLEIGLFKGNNILNRTNFKMQTCKQTYSLATRCQTLN